MKLTVGSDRDKGYFNKLFIGDCHTSGKQAVGNVLVANERITKKMDSK